MKPIYQRIFAILLLCLPAVIGIYGWKILRDAVFDLFAGQPVSWLKIGGGSLCLLFALYVIGGFIFYRDKKRNKIDPRLLKNK
ncbi:Protein of unknown function [Seinonella peptonophila]|uniref:DUF2627 domain-containing protein n=1 Tax=Seinonella peptonophila TaxID=112248 RepID=A0A1M4TLA3_9BACL|nr:DUF2627 family protein [Seinonella peptonophila]SHE45240.1 Protein of unknown function [Seinonella peptonophila]